MTTLKDLSRHLGLSVTQVSRALNDHSDVSDGTKERVRQAAFELNYQPNLMARRLVTGRSGIVGFLQPRIPTSAESAFFTNFLSGLSENFAKFDRQFMLHMSDKTTDELEAYDRLVRTRSIDGFVVTEPEFDDKRVNFLRKKKIPFVLHGQTMDAPDYPFFDIDNVAVGYDLTKMLIDRGHKRILFINGAQAASYAERRVIGYQKALKEAGIKFDPDMVVRGNMVAETGLLETIRAFQRSGEKPTAIIAGNTRISTGALMALAAMGLSMPEDVSLVAHDDQLPADSNGDLPRPVSGTSSPLSASWEPLAENLSRFLDGAELSEVQTIAPHTFVDHGSIKTI